MRGDLLKGYRAERLRKLTDYGPVGILYSGQRVSVFTAMIEVGKKLNWGTEMLATGLCSQYATDSM
jgi:hypothetical protein